MPIDEHDDEDEDCEEEENEEEEIERDEEEEEEVDEQRQAGPSVNVAKDKSIQKGRTRTLMGHANTRTGEAMTDPVEEDEDEEEQEEEQEEEDYEEEEEEEEEVVRPCHWDSTVREREIQRVGFWHRRAHRQ